MQSTVDAAVKSVEIFEGKVPWIYLDTKGNATIGVGQLLRTVSEALLLPFWKDGFGADSKATPDEIVDDWNRVKSAPFGQRYPAEYFRWGGSCFLKSEDIDAMLRKVIDKLDTDLSFLYMDYENWPQPAQLAVIDMAYNLGTAALQTYHHMNASLRATPPDFLNASKECDRDETDPAFQRRNIWTRAQFVQAHLLSCGNVAVNQGTK